MDRVVIGVPIDCVGAPLPGGAHFGCELAPEALRAAGLARRVAAIDAGDLPVRLIGQERDAVTGVNAWPSVVGVTDAVRTSVSGVVARGDLPVLVGGCCTLLPGALAGARDAAGPVGLAYVDGHLDLYDGVTSPTGEPADMPIAVIMGHGPAAWVSHVEAPLVVPANLVLLGPRDRDEAEELGSMLPEMLGLAPEVTPDEIRRAGADATGIAARRRLGAGPFWVHVDVDALDQDEFPATDYLMPGGLLLAELVALLAPLLRSRHLIGFSLACYNPEKDFGGTHAARLVDALSAAFGA